MPIRQHPLLRYYAKATSIIPLSWLCSSDFPSREDLTRVCRMAVDEMPPFPPGEDPRHDRIRDLLEWVAEGGHPAGGSLRVQARRAAGLLADYATRLALMGTEIPGQVVPGSVLHFFSDGLSDQMSYGLGHRRVIEVTDYSIIFDT